MELEPEPKHFTRFTTTMKNFFNFMKVTKPQVEEEIGGSSKGEGEGEGRGGGGDGGSSSGGVVDGGGGSSAGVVDGGGGGGQPDNLEKVIQEMVREEMTANWDRSVHHWYGYFVSIVPLLAFISKIESRTLLRELNRFGIGVLATTIGAIIIHLQSRLNRR